MTWAYLITFNGKVGTRSIVQEYLTTIPEVTYWYGCLPNTIFLTSTLSAGELSDKIKDNFGTGGGQRWFIAEVGSDRQGWLPKEVWHMLKNPANPRLSKNDN